MESLDGAAKEKMLPNDSSSELSIEERIELLRLARRYAHHAKAASFLVSPNRVTESPSTALEPNLVRPCTSYVLSRDDHLESNVDCWLESTEDHYEEQTPILRRNAYMLALLPLLNLQHQRWCSPRNSIVMVLNTVDMMNAWFKQFVAYLLTLMSRLDIDQVLQDGFIVVLDIVIALHGLVFLMLTFYKSYV